MKHLTTDEMLKFVSLKKLNNETIQFSAAVNRHIRECDNCLKCVRAFQNIYDEFSHVNAEKNFEEFVSEQLSETMYESIFAGGEKKLKQNEKSR